MISSLGRAGRAPQALGLALLGLLLAAPGTARPLQAPPRSPSTAPALAQLPRVITSLDTWCLYPVDHRQAALRALRAACDAVGEPPPQGSPLRPQEALQEQLTALCRRHPAEAATVQASALRAYVASIGDPYTTWLTAADQATLRAQLTGGSFVGIGIEVAPHPQGLEVVAALDDLPAAHAGLHVGQVIRAVDQRPLRGLDYYTAADTLLGPSGAAVTLDLLDGQRLQVTRRALRMPPLRAVTVRPGIGYLRIPIFGPDSGREAWAGLMGLLRSGSQRFIIDLRGNPGGDLASALSLAAALAPGQVLVRVAHRDRPTEVRTAQGSPQAHPPPIVLLVDRGTASSAEVFAAALTDSKRAALFGTRTFGKGVIQTVIPLEDGSCLKVTSGRYQTPAGREVDHTGLVPTLAPSPRAPSPGGADDPWLREATDWLAKQPL